jgi:hypothetical protein
MDMLDKYVDLLLKGDPSVIAMSIVLVGSMIMMVCGIISIFTPSTEKEEDFVKPPDMPESNVFWVCQEGVFAEEGNCMKKLEL